MKKKRQHQQESEGKRGAQKEKKVRLEREKIFQDLNTRGSARGVVVIVKGRLMGERGFTTIPFILSRARSGLHN